MLPGDQHKGLVNPFDETRISAYTAAEIATLQAKLDQQLGPEFISSRPGAGGKKIHYLQADKCINLANQVFGFNGWSSTVKTIELDFLDQSKDGKWTIGLSVTVRVTLRDGTFHEDIGYGTMENGKTKAQVFEKAKKEGTTDALKRALRNFGNILGNCLYDKEYLGKVTKLRAPPHRFEERKLHRHSEPAPQIKKEPIVGASYPSGLPPRDSVVLNPPSEEKPQESPETFDEYGGDEFEELGIFGNGGDDPFDDLMPDEVAVDFSDESLKGPTPPNISTAITTTSGQNNLNYNTSANRQNLQTPQPQRVHQVGRNIITPKLQHPQPQFQQNRPVQPPQFQRPAQAQAQPANQHQPMQRPQANPPQVPRVPTPQGGFQGSPTPVRVQPPTNNGSNFRNVQQSINQRSHPPPQQQQQQQQNQQQQLQKSPPPVPTIAAPQLNGGPETPNNPPPQNPPIGFFSGRAVVNVAGEDKLIPDQALAFNPHQQTSIPRSHGIDHSKSSPIPRKVLSGPQGPAGGAYVRPNFENPSMSMNRQIGMPPQARGTGSFRQPGPAAGVKRPAEVTAPGGNNSRPTLGDALGTNLNKQVAPNFGNDPKRQARMS